MINIMTTHCTPVLYCTVLYCTVLYCTVHLNDNNLVIKTTFSILQCITSYTVQDKTWITILHITLQYSTLYYSTLHYITVQYITLQYITLHYSTVQHFKKC